MSASAGQPAAETAGSAAEIKSTWYYSFLSHYGYLAFFLVLIAISMGIPLPEEIFLLTAGYLAHLTITEPEIGINVHIITIVCFTGILGGDLFIYSLGRFRGEKVRQWRWFKRLLPDTAFVRVRSWFDRFGVGATAAFRFIPPIRMPGFFAAGLLRQSPLKFLMADGIACLVSIPTQIYLVYYFGEYVIPYVKKFNMILIGGIVLFVIGYAIWELIHRKKAASIPNDTAADSKSSTGIAALEGADAQHIHAIHLHQKGSEENPKPPAAPPGN
ncbi:MAG TPA: DedA family protein [Planctomycetota bacterium]|nr:DedA family protein [Planctomycetota bacterium]